MVRQARIEFGFKVFAVCLVTYAILNSYTVLGSLRCERDQSSLINQETVLDCTITGRYYGVYWYIGESRDSIIRYINGHKAGSEYQRGKLDIASNGSMIIKNVGLNDEGTYRVMVVWKEGGDDNTYVHLTVIVPSSRDTPEINHCNATSESCRLCVYQSVFLECSMDGRPPVDLKWLNASSEIPQDFQNSTESSPLATFISISKVKVPMGDLEIKEITCVPSGLAVTFPDKTVKNASILLISPSDPYVSHKETHYLPVSNLSKVIGQNNSKTVAWIKQTSAVDYSFEIPTCKALDWSENGKLNLQLNSDFEGIYTQVVKKDGNTFKRNVYEIRQAMAPKQLHFIEECLSQDPQNCIIYVNGTGTLNCSVTDSRPAAAVTWKVAQSGPEITQLDSINSCEHGMRKCKTSVKIKFRFTSTKVNVGEFKCLVSGPWNKGALSSSVKVINNLSLSSPSSTWFMSTGFISTSTHLTRTTTQDTGPGNQLLTTTQSADKNAGKAKTAAIVVPCVTIVILSFVFLIRYKSKSGSWNVFMLFTREKCHDEDLSLHKNGNPNSSKKGEENKVKVLEGETNVASTS